MIIVADVETTGDDPTVDQICELAMVRLSNQPLPLVAPDGRVVDQPWPVMGSTSALCGVTVPMDPRARASHHIDPADLIGLPPASARLATPWTDGAVALAAHLATFDAGFLQVAAAPAPLPPLVCTYRCALHLWPEAPAFGLQVLRYWLDLDVGPLPPGQHQHRALYDALVCAALLRRMLGMRTLEQLIALTTAPALLLTCKMGDHRGKPWSEVPRGFLSWVWRKRATFDADVVHTVDHWLTVMETAERQAKLERDARAAAAASAHLVALKAQAAQHDGPNQEDAGNATGGTQVSAAAHGGAGDPA